MPKKKQENPYAVSTNPELDLQNVQKTYEDLSDLLDLVDVFKANNLNKDLDQPLVEIETLLINESVRLQSQAGRLLKEYKKQIGKAKTKKEPKNTSDLF